MVAKRGSFQRRLLLVVTMASTLGATLTCAGFVGYQRAQLRENLHQELDTLARMLAANNVAALAFHDRAAAEESMRLLEANSHVDAAVLFDQKGLPFASIRGKTPTTGIPLEEGFAIADGRMRLSTPVALDGQRIGTALLESGMGDITSQLNRFICVAVALGLLGMAGSFLVLRRMSNTIAEPLLELTRIAGRVSAEKNYSLRVAKLHSDETGVLISQEAVRPHWGHRWR